jgi:hypothetical protein
MYILYAGYLQLYKWKQPMVLGYIVLPVLYIYNLWYTWCSFPRWIFSILYTQFPKYVYSAQYGCGLQLLNFVLSHWVAKVFSKLIWDCSTFPNSYWYHFCFYIPPRCISIVISLYFKINSVSFLITFLSPETATSINIQDLFPLPRIMTPVLIIVIIIIIHSERTQGRDV